MTTSDPGQKNTADFFPDLDTVFQIYKGKMVLFFWTDLHISKVKYFNFSVQENQHTGSPDHHAGLNFFITAQ